MRSYAIYVATEDLWMEMRSRSQVCLTNLSLKLIAALLFLRMHLHAPCDEREKRVASSVRSSTKSQVWNRRWPFKIASRELCKAHMAREGQAASGNATHK